MREVCSGPHVPNIAIGDIEHKPDHVTVIHCVVCGFEWHVWAPGERPSERVIRLLMRSE